MVDWAGQMSSRASSPQGDSHTEISDRRPAPFVLSRSMRATLLPYRVCAAIPSLPNSGPCATLGFTHVSIPLHHPVPVTIVLNPASSTKNPAQCSVKSAIAKMWEFCRSLATRLSAHSTCPNKLPCALHPDASCAMTPPALTRCSGPTL